MDGKRNRIRGLTLALCAVLLGLNLWQWQQLQNLRREAGQALVGMDPSGSSEGTEASPPEEAEDEAAFAWVECARVDPASRTMTLRIRLERPNAGDAYSVNVRYGAEGRSKAAALHRLPDGALGGEFTLPLEISGGIEIAESNGTPLYSRDRLAALLPVQLYAYPDLLFAEGMAYLRECRIELTDPQGGWAEVSDAEYRVDWNGETVFSGDCGTIPRGPVELEPWTHPFEEGDTMEYHVLCTDSYGLRYDFTLYKRPAGEPADGPAIIWPAE